MSVNDQNMETTETILFDSALKSEKSPVEKPVERSRIIMVVDETGSMSRHKPVTISSYNEWLDSNRTKEEDEDHFPKFSLIKFNTVTKLQEFDSVETAPRLLESDYNPSNMTALYDALGETMINYESESDNIMVILTDGEENSSRKWTQKMIQEKIKFFTEEKGWIFHYLGANQDAWAVGSSIGITDKKFTTTYSADDGGFSHSFAQNQAQTRNYRGHQARKKKGMFVPTLNEMEVPTIDKKAYLENRTKNANSQNVSTSQTLAQPTVTAQDETVAAPTAERTLFTSGQGSRRTMFSNNSQSNMNLPNQNRAPTLFSQASNTSLFGNNYNVPPGTSLFGNTSNLEPGTSLFGNNPNVQRKASITKKKSRSRPMAPEFGVGMFGQPQTQSLQNDKIQQAVVQSQQNKAEIQQDFNQLFQNSDKDMQDALKNSLNENY